MAFSTFMSDDEENLSNIYRRSATEELRDFAFWKSSN